jgi:hypothetical protein
MDLTSLIFVIIGSCVTLAIGTTSLVWWAYRRGVDAGAEQASRAGDRARIATLERQLAVLRQQPGRG